MLWRNADNSVRLVDDKLVSTDPPYYDNIGYADLSDFFYVWLRRLLGSGLIQISSLRWQTPKVEELSRYTLPAW